MGILKIPRSTPTRVAAGDQELLLRKPSIKQTEEIVAVLRAHGIEPAWAQIRAMLSDDEIRGIIRDGIGLGERDKDGNPIGVDPKAIMEALFARANDLLDRAKDILFPLIEGGIGDVAAIAMDTAANRKELALDADVCEDYPEAKDRTSAAFRVWFRDEVPWEDAFVIAASLPGLFSWAHLGKAVGAFWKNHQNAPSPANLMPSNPA